MFFCVSFEHTEKLILPCFWFQTEKIGAESCFSTLRNFAYIGPPHFPLAFSTLPPLFRSSVTLIFFAAPALRHPFPSSLHSLSSSWRRAVIHACNCGQNMLPFNRCDICALQNVCEPVSSLWLTSSHLSRSQFYNPSSSILFFVIIPSNTKTFNFSSPPLEALIFFSPQVKITAVN